METGQTQGALDARGQLVELLLVAPGLDWAVSMAACAASVQLGGATWQITAQGAQRWLVSVDGRELGATDSALTALSLVLIKAGDLVRVSASKIDVALDQVTGAICAQAEAMGADDAADDGASSADVARSEVRRSPQRPSDDLEIAQLRETLEWLLEGAALDKQTAARLEVSISRAYGVDQVSELGAQALRDLTTWLHKWAPGKARREAIKARLDRSGGA